MPIEAGGRKLGDKCWATEHRDQADIVKLPGEEIPREPILCKLGCYILGI